MNKFKNTRKSRKNRKSKRIYGKGNYFGIEIPNEEIPKDNKSPKKKGVSFDIEAQLPVTSSNVSSETVSDYEISNINYKGLNRSETMSPRSFRINRSPTPDIESQLQHDDEFIYGKNEDPNERSYKIVNAKQTTDDRTKYYHPGKYPEDMSQEELNSKKAHEIMGNKFGGKKRRKRKTKRKNKKKRKTRKNSHLGWFH